MTGRELILRIVNSTDNLDGQVAVYLLQRDNNGGVIKKQQATECTFVNGKLYIEQNSLCLVKE